MAGMAHAEFKKIICLKYYILNINSFFLFVCLLQLHLRYFLLKTWQQLLK